MKTKHLHRVLWFLIPLLTLFNSPLWADDSYTITFGNNASSAQALTQSTKASTVISEGTDYVTASPFTVNSGNIYYGDTKTCIRLGKSGTESSLTITLSETGKVHATTIIVNAANTGGKKNSNATLAVNSAGAQTTTENEDNYTFEINDDISNITLAGSASVKIFSIKVNYGSGCSGTKLATPSVTAIPSSGQIKLTWGSVANASSYQVKWGTGDWTTATSPFTKTGLTNGTTYSWQVKAIGNGSTYCDGDAAVGQTKAGTAYTITWKVNGSTYQTTYVSSGDKLVLPTNPTSCDAGKEFVGWSELAISGSTNTKPTFVSNQTTISAAKTYHAVFATKNSEQLLCW